MQRIADKPPYISLGLASVIMFVFSTLVANKEANNILISIFLNSVVFFLAYLLYYLIRQIILNKEKQIKENFYENLRKICRSCNERILWSPKGPAGV